jgi:6-phosphogluconate dehydrogenase
MEIGMVGLGKMGGNMTVRLLNGGHGVVVYDRNTDAVKGAEGEGAVASESFQDLVGKLGAPRVVWIMVPAGAPTENVIGELAGFLSGGDVIIDGGNSNYKDTVHRGEKLRERGIHFVDVGTSGGVWGLKEGYSMMVGGEKDIVDRLGPSRWHLRPIEAGGT